MKKIFLKNLGLKKFIRKLFIQMVNTPNPDSIKFYPTGKKVLENDQTVYFESPLDSYKRYSKIF
jgi:hypothetical protein